MSGAITTVVQAKVFTDGTGAYAEMPVVLTERGVLDPLLDYFLLMAGRSRAWQQNVVRAVRLLLEYGGANGACFGGEEELFASFAERLHSGTIGDDGLDPSGLYWRPLRRVRAKALLHALDEFTAYLARERGGAQPLRTLQAVSSHEEMLAWAAWMRRKQHSFLGHTSSAAAPRLSFPRWSAARRVPCVIGEEVKAFPEDRFMNLLLHGFVDRGRGHERNLAARLNLRDCLITLLMHGAGCRLSECFHLYVEDVSLDPHDPTLTRVRVHHPIDGAAPSDWTDEKGKPVHGNRLAYLARIGLRPRLELRDARHAGWKNPSLDGSFYMELRWFPRDYGRLFLKLWKFYLLEIAGVPRAHPFAWLTLAPSEPGAMYCMTHYHRAHARAVQRIGLAPAKNSGTTAHGHRHAYGRRLYQAEIDPLVRMRAMHHRSLHSQLVYTQPQVSEVVRMLGNVEARMAMGSGSPAVPAALLASGFEDVDPDGLLSGMNPKLCR